MSEIANNKIILSVIIPVYNVEKYLKRCLNSVLSQLSEDMEIIIIDDGSTDNSGKICEQYTKKYGSVINVIHQKNGGLSSARNTGIENARGEYLYFLDSDDYISSKFIQTVYGYLLPRKYDILEFDSFWQTKEGVITLKMNNTVHEYSGLELIDKLIQNEVGCQIWRRIYKSSLFEGIRFPVGRNYEDISVYYQLLIRSKVNLVIDSQLHIYNLLNVNSITQKANLKNLSDMYLAVNEMHDGLLPVVEENHFDKMYLEYYKRCIYIYILLKLHKSNLRDNEIYQQIRDYLSKNNQYDYIKYKNYGLKRLFAYQLLKMFHQF